MTDLETIGAQQKLIEKLERKVKRLEKRLLTKKKYEEMMLVNACATPSFIAEINEKDRRALSD